MLGSLRLSPSLPLNRFFCKCSERRETIDMAKYREAFSRRMTMAGLKPHHRIAMGVSGGPDSVALCVLTAGWKADAQVGMDETTGCIDGLLAIIVDHGLRAESKDEANCVRDRVSRMGIKCEVARCKWSSGKPKQGHLQEAAREMRYNIFQNVCVQHQIGVLLIAHHADDQAELFILRLSRNSGVLGLAGMAFTSQLFSAYTHCDESSTNHRILLVRPLLEFSKEDMYKICLRSNQEWVEDPTNRSPLFARNRIRMSLGNLSCTIRSELQKLISTCRKTRSFVDTICNGLIDRAVTITTHGYAIIDLEKLNPSNIEDICLSKFASLVLQFISQRHRPVRSRTSQLLLDYIRKFPCKTSLTAAGCYLCAAPGSKGSNIIVCCSLDSPHPSKMETSWTSFSEGMKYCPQTEMQQIIMDGKSYSNSLLPGASEVPFLDVTPSGSLLNEAKNLGILSELTHKSILLLQKEENENFKTKNEIMFEHDFRHEIKSASAFLREPLQSGKICHFMSRFLVTWRLCRESIEDTFPLEETCCTWNSEGESGDYLCRSCIVSHETVAEVRPMVDSDWLYLANLSKSQIRESQHFQLGDMMNQREMNSCIDYVRLSAQRALQSLKSIPVAARRSLPVLVNPQGLLLSIPSICFKHCPYLMVSSEFKPRVPLGGHSSFI